MNEEHLIALAEGKGTRETREHVNQCAPCQRRVKQFRHLIDRLRFPLLQPSPQALKRAKAIGKASGKRVTARLVSTSLAMAGVRRASSPSFQSVYETQGVRVRLMYQLRGEQWDVRGRVTPPIPASLYVGGSRKATAIDEEGRFAYQVKDLARAGLRLVFGKTEISVPAPSLKEPSEKKRAKKKKTKGKQ